MSRCDSAAIVANTSELLPEPETPVNTVRRRFGISMLTSLRLLTRAPCTRIRSWASAMCSSGSVVVAMVIVCSLVLQHAQHVAVGVGERRDQAATADVVRGLLDCRAGRGDVG